MELKINNQKFDFWNNFSLTLKFDGVASMFNFSGYFKPDNDQHKELFKPFSFPKVEVIHDGETLLTGTLLNDTKEEEKVKHLVSIAGYSLPGVLEDASIPISLYPLQSDNRSLTDITDRLIEPFGLSLSIDPEVLSDASKIIKVSTADANQSIKGYLTELATQKNIIITHTEAGELLFTRAATTVNPVMVFDNSVPAVNIKLENNGQKMHSEITVQKQAEITGGNAGESTVSNPYVSEFRPLVKIQSSGTDIDTELAARNALSTELKNIKLTIDLDRWTWTKNGNTEIIKPNNIVSVIAPELYLYKKTNFFVEAVTFTGDEKEQKATLICTLPEVYNTNTPENIFDA